MRDPFCTRSEPFGKVCRCRRKAGTGATGKMTSARSSTVEYEKLATALSLTPEALEMLHTEIAPPSDWNPVVTRELGQVVLHALERDPDRRFATAREFAVAIERATSLASMSEVADWVKAVGGAKLADRVERVAAIESHSSNRLRVAARSPMLTPRIIESEPISARLIVEDGDATGRVWVFQRKCRLRKQPSRKRSTATSVAIKLGRTPRGCGKPCL